MEVSQQRAQTTQSEVTHAGEKSLKRRATTPTAAQLTEEPPVTRDNKKVKSVK